MTRSLALLTLLPLVAGCSLFSPPPAASADTDGAAPEKASVKKADKSKSAKAAKDADEPGAEVVAKVVDHLSVGHYVVQRFSGSALEAPIDLTERIIELDGELTVMEYRFEQAGEVAEFRVHLRSDRLTPEKVLRIDGEAEIEAPVEDFDSWMDKTVFAADSNLGRLGAKQRSCLVGGEAFDCKTTKYRVLIGEREATLAVTASVRFGSRDLAGTLTDADGEVLYDVHVLDVGNDAPSTGVARRD